MRSLGRLGNVAQQAAVPAEYPRWDTAAWPPRTRVNLTRPGGSELDARSRDSIKLSVKLAYFFRTCVVVRKVGIRQASVLPERVDLQLNQLRCLAFDSGGWVRHHGGSPREMIARRRALGPDHLWRILWKKGAPFSGRNV